MTREEWRPVIGYETDYLVSNDGRVVSLKFGKKRLLRPGNANGYRMVRLCVSGTISNKAVHRLVAEAFLPNPQDHPIVNHRNGVRTDNRVENLEWISASQNSAHAARVLGKTRPKGSGVTAHYIEIPDDQQSLFNSKEAS